MSPSQIRRILVIKHGGLGDIVQAEGAFRDIRQAHPTADIAVLTAPPFVKLFERCPHVDRVLADPRAPRWRLDKFLLLGLSLKAQNFDLVYDLQNSGRTADYRRYFLSRPGWSGKAVSATYRFDMANFASRRSFDRLAAQLKVAGIRPVHAKTPDLTWMIGDAAPFLDQAGITEPPVVLLPGSSSTHPQKRWPGYAALAEALSARGETVVFAPGPDELDLVGHFPATPIVAPRGFLDFFELAGLFARAKAVIGNDSGPTHLAAQLRRPGVALFGGQIDPARTGITDTRFEVIERIPLKDVSVDEVLAAADRACNQAVREELA